MYSILDRPNSDSLYLYLSAMIRHCMILLLVAAKLCYPASKAYAAHEPQLHLRRAPLVLDTTKNHRHLQTVDWTEWYVAFEKAEAEFDGSTNPNVALTYNGPVPLSSVKYYQLRVMDPTCSQFVSDGAIKPRSSNGILPDNGYDPTTSQMEALLDIDTTKIESSTVFYTAGEKPEQFTLSFCARCELYNNDDMALAAENTIVTFTVDTTQDFEIGNIKFEDEEVTIASEMLLVNFPLNRFSCNDSFNPEATANILPGQKIQFCISSGSSEARTVSLRSVRIENSEDPDLSIPLVDSTSNEANSHTFLNCANGICNLKTIAFARLFEKPYPDGTVKDISSTSKIVGTVMLELVPGRRNLSEEAPGDTAATGFDFSLPLARPPPSSSSSSLLSLSTIGAALVGACMIQV